MPRMAARLFFRAIGNRERARGYGVGELAGLWYEAYKDIYADLNACYRDPSFLKIAVVRHPLPRAVSAFGSVLGSKSGLQWRAVARSIEHPSEERRLSFLEFLEFLENIDLATANYHWRLQTAQDWRDLPDVQLVRLEHLRPELDAICRKLGRKPVPVWTHSVQPKVSASMPAEELLHFTRPDFERVFGRDRRSSIRFPPYANFLTPAVMARLAKLYAPDFALLGYSPDGAEGRFA